MIFDFTAALVLLTLVSGLICLYDRWTLAPRRRRRQSRAWTPRTPRTVEYARSFFPVLLIVLLLRSFLFEPFRIPSGSMYPTLAVGDFVLVNKFAYGLRLPVANLKFFDVGLPQRGDIMVFRYPEDPSIDFIKRVFATPGDRVRHEAGRFYINGEALDTASRGDYRWRNRDCRAMQSERYAERNGAARYDILNTPSASPSAPFDVEVPAGSYFVLGDNRDHSRDSRYWGFVPERNIVGKAVAIWMNWGFRCGEKGIQWRRIGAL